MRARVQYPLHIRFSASSVNRDTGVLRGVTVAKSGVQAKGKYVMLDAAGNVTRDAKLAKQKLPVFADKEFLDTILAAAQDAGGKLKVRSDHDDSIGSRAGYATNFALEGDRVTCDIYLNDSYKDRGTVLETVAKSPELIGCSIDFAADYEIKDKKAFMRVLELSAVDIVDEGAVTPAGMFMSSEVDSAAEDESNLSTKLKTSLTMAKKDDELPSIEECMAGLSKLTETVAGLAAAMKSLAATPATMQASLDKINETLAAEKTARESFEKEQNAKLAAMAKERAALGISTTAAGKLGEENADAAAEAERTRLAAEKDKNKPKTYLQLVSEVKAAKKISGYAAHREVMASHPDLYEKHLLKLGVTKAE